MRPHAVVLCGFDRSGTSVISRTLTQHPQVELFMQPFNSGPVRSKMNELWTDEVASEEDVRFFGGLQDGRLDRTYVRSHWFQQSTTKEFIPGKLHVVKTTLNHFVTRWSQRRFPGLPHWAIWRNPMDILASLVRNGFVDAWYRGAFDEIQPAIRSDPELARHFAHHIPRVDGSPQAEAAFVIAVRTFALFREIPPAQVLSYERFLRTPSGECGKFFSAYGLGAFAVHPPRNGNLVGKPYEAESDHQTFIEAGAQEIARRLFDELAEISGTIS